MSKLIAIPAFAPEKNDILVTMSSAHGHSTFVKRIRETRGAEGRLVKNHASVADSFAANLVFQWVVGAEQRSGDLR